MTTTVKTTQDLIGKTFADDAGNEYEILSFPIKLKNNCSLLRLKEGGRTVYASREFMPRVQWGAVAVLQKLGIKPSEPSPISAPLPPGLAGLSYTGVKSYALDDIEDIPITVTYGNESDWRLPSLIHRPLRVEFKGLALTRCELVPPWGDLTEYKKLRLEAAQLVPDGCTLDKIWLDADYLTANGWAILPLD